MKNSKTILIDFHSLAYRNFFSIKSQFGLFQSDAWNYFMVKSILKIVDAVSPFEYMIFCFDSPLSWRKVIYPEYKANRTKKDEDKEEWKSFYLALNSFSDFITNILPFGVIKTDLAEGDDIISTISKNVKNCIIVSPDKDFVQCLIYGDDIKIYNPMKEEFVFCDNPKRELQIHCYIGDKSDNIPNVKRGIGPKTAERIIDGSFDKDQEIIYKERFNRFLIDFDFIPMKINDDIMQCFDDLMVNKRVFDKEAFCDFCEGNNIQEFWKNIDDICEIFESFQN